MVLPLNRREELQFLLESLLDSENVYFQPPTSIRMVYPCIVYERNNMDTVFADNNPYAINVRYSVTVIDLNPDSLILSKIGSLPTSSFSRHFISDNLNHDVFNLYF